MSVIYAKLRKNIIREKVKKLFFYKGFVNLFNQPTILAKNYGQNCEKTALCLTPQATHNQFKRPSAGIVSELYYIYRKT